MHANEGAGSAVCALQMMRSEADYYFFFLNEIIRPQSGLIHFIRTPHVETAQKVIGEQVQPVKNRYK